MEKTAFDLGVELKGVSAALYVLSENFDAERERTVSDTTVCDMLHAVLSQITRISDDLLCGSYCGDRSDK